MQQAEQVRCPATGRAVLGQRPVTVRWTPSKPLPWWYGCWVPGRRFTVEQEEALISLGRDPVTAEAMDVRREINIHDPAESGMPIWYERLPVYLFACPVLGPGRAGLIRVIGPRGKPHDVRADGWAHKPTEGEYTGIRW